MRVRLWSFLSRLLLSSHWLHIHHDNAVRGSECKKRGTADRERVRKTARVDLLLSAHGWRAAVMGVIWSFLNIQHPHGLICRDLSVKFTIMPRPWRGIRNVREQPRQLKMWLTRWLFFHAAKCLTFIYLLLSAAAAKLISHDVKWQ